ncbi:MULTISPECIES: hypothetical protein [unclassified Streptomyces]|uniref:Uncharacterized protein n=1 Tax=Streptomyces evansiae TaxID=3075535 RepID=A0ABD5E2P3_9ACTN|nr:MULTISPECIES: hypothetical protein [unclassified Streptomyces]ASY36341.1 hypothetical protein CAC01_29620 [Streptomyces sp. CLI2509]EFK98193.1 conserved hypothetical protein [Streptomyces sp. SPB78]EGJ79149.1 hypothetical protein STTU_6360 [Streptomyces sp. Tu6071]MDT0409094.1 hypothetical protein [Streptomyces sp. DSM 41979]MDT0415542.1 hypothetical protein [Streptomyces sp. DSM 41982]
MDQDQSAQVVVELQGCSARDADAVLTALAGAFGTDRAASDTPSETPGERPTVWSATFDTSDRRGRTSPVRIDAALDLTAQGGYHAVTDLQEALDEVYAVEVLGSASGDQEKEIQLRLTPA